MSGPKKFWVYHALHAEANEGWAWLRFDDVENLKGTQRPVVKIRNMESREYRFYRFLFYRYIFCEARDIDKNYRKMYHQGNTRYLLDEPLIIMNDWHRKKLCIENIPSDNPFPLSVTLCNSWYGKIMACRHHPQVVVRLALRLSGISLFIGFLSITLAVCSKWKT